MRLVIQARWRREGVVLGGFHALDVGRERLHLLLGLAQGVGERWGGATARDELDEVVDAGLGAVQLDLLEAQLLRDVGEQILGRAAARAARARCSTGCLRIFGSEGEHPRSRSGVLCGARGAVLLLLRAAAACEIELREKDVGVCHSGEHGGAQVSLCSTPFTDSWRAQALTPSCATTRAGTKS